MGKSVHWIFVTLLLSYSRAEVTRLDLSGPDCDRVDGVYLQSADDEVIAYAVPQYNTQATRDHCDVTIRADTNRRIQYVIELVNFNECGVTIFLFDNPTIDANARQITCNDNNKVPFFAKTSYNVLRIRVRKTTPESRVFEFRIRMRNDLGPTLEFEQESKQWAGQALEPGVIAGIAIAGGLVVIALILLAIYLCIRFRQNNLKAQHQGSKWGESSVYTSGNSQVLFATAGNRRRSYGSTEDVRSTNSSQDKANGAYGNPAYTGDPPPYSAGSAPFYPSGPNEKGSERSSSVGRARGKAGFRNEAYIQDEGGNEGYWDEREGSEMRGSKRMSRRDGHDKKPMKSALKKPTNIEMSKVNTQPNGILKTRSHSPNRSQTSSTDTSVNTNTTLATIYGYNHLGKDQPNVHHKPVIERRRSRSGTRSNRSASSAGRASSHGRSHSADRKKQPKNSSRMYGEVFIDEGRRNRSSGRRSRSDSARRSRSDRTDRGSESMDSASSTTSYSRKVSMNPGGKRVHIKGEETDI